MREWILCETGCQSNISITNIDINANISYLWVIIHVMTIYMNWTYNIITEQATFLLVDSIAFLILIFKQNFWKVANTKLNILLLFHSFKLTQVNIVYKQIPWQKRTRTNIKSQIFTSKAKPFFWKSSEIMNFYVFLYFQLCRIIAQMP